MATYEFLGKSISFSDAEERYFDMYLFTREAANKSMREFYKWYQAQHDILTVLKAYESKAVELLSKYASDPLFSKLVELELYDISKERFEEECFCVDAASDAFEKIAQKYNEIVGEQEAAVEYRAERKASRGRVVGGGFGVGGAVKGMAAAGAMNAVSGLGHSVVNAFGNAMSAIAASAQKRELYENDNTCSLLCEGIYCDIFAIVDLYISFINEKFEKYYDCNGDSDKAKALFLNALRVPGKEKELLTHSFVNDPWNSELYEFIFKEYKEERVKIWEIAKRFHIDLSKVAEDCFAAQYEASNKNSEDAVQAVKADIVSQMKNLGIKHSDTVQKIETDCVERLLRPYLTMSDDERKTLFESLEKYDASNAIKAEAVRQFGIWELAKTYSVTFKREEAEKIIARYYPEEAKKSEQKALIAKEKIKVVMEALGVKESDTYDKLEQDCLSRLCEGYASADEATCNTIIEKIKAYDALEKNKNIFLQKVRGRIDAIWTAEDAKVFDSLYVKTDIYDKEAVQGTMASIKAQGRTENAKKYVAALSMCHQEGFGKALRYKSKSAKGILYAGIGLIGLGLLLWILGLGFFVGVPMMVVGGIFCWYYHTLNVAWNTLTLDGTVVHPLLNAQEYRKHKKRSTLKKKNVILFAVIILLSAISIFSFMDELSWRRSYDDTYDAYLEASLNFDAEALVDLLHPSYIEEQKKLGKIKSKEDLIEIRQYKFDLLKDNKEYFLQDGGEYAPVKTKEENNDKTDSYWRLRLSTILGDTAEDVQAAKYVTVNYTLKNDLEETILYTDYYFTFVKIGNRWYLGEIPQF